MAKDNKKQKDIKGIKRLVTIAKLKAVGKNNTEIGEEVGLRRSRVQTLTQRDDVKELIEVEQTKLAAFVPKAVENMQYWIENATKKTNDQTDKRLGYDATKDLLQSTGILNNQPSHLVQILYNDNKTIISPVIQKLLDGFMGKIEEAGVIDCEYEDVCEAKEVPAS